MGGERGKLCLKVQSRALTPERRCDCPQTPSLGARGELGKSEKGPLLERGETDGGARVTVLVLKEKINKKEKKS